jgi:predicted RNase H-like nuclease (RuvC/YqgF family)
VARRTGQRIRFRLMRGDPRAQPEFLIGGPPEPLPAVVRHVERPRRPDPKEQAETARARAAAVRETITALRQEIATSEHRQRLGARRIEKLRRRLAALEGGT